VPQDRYEKWWAYKSSDNWIAADALIAVLIYREDRQASATIAMKAVEGDIPCAPCVPLASIAVK